jgi:hypothetical protein
MFAGVHLERQTEKSFFFTQSRPETEVGSAVPNHERIRNTDESYWRVHPDCARSSRSPLPWFCSVQGQSGRNQKDLQGDISKELGMELNNCRRYWRQMWICSSYEKRESLISRVLDGNRESKVKWMWRWWNDNSEKCPVRDAETGLVWFGLV